MPSYQLPVTNYHLPITLPRLPKTRLLEYYSPPSFPAWGERMFASIQRGFGFLGQAIDLARKDSDLLKPSLYSLLVSAVAAVIGAVPLVVVAVLAGETQPGRISLYVLGALLIFVQYTIA